MSFRFYKLVCHSDTSLRANRVISNKFIKQLPMHTCTKKTLSEAVAEWKNAQDQLTQHECSLSDNQDIVEQFISSGEFKKFRQWLRRITMLSEFHPDLKIYFKSMTAVQQENLRHLRHYYHMIHPLSDASSFWELLMVLVYLVTYFVVPVVANWKMDYLREVKLGTDVLCMVDIFINFNTGYTNFKTKEVVLSVKEVRRKYILGYFFADFVGALPLDFMFYHIGRPSHWLMIPVTLRLLRLPTVIINIGKFFGRFCASSYRLNAAKIILLYFLVIWWMAWIMLAIVMFNWGSEDSWFTADMIGDRDPLEAAFLHSLLRAIYITALVGGYGITPSRITLDIVVAIFGLAVGFILNLFLLVEFLEMVSTSTSSYMKYQAMIQQLREYMRYKKLPEYMRKRIENYYEYRYKNRFYKDSEVSGIISNHLKEEISMSVCGRFLDKVSYMAELPKEIKSKLSTLIKDETFLANDVIVQCGRPGDRLYFLATGTAAVFTRNGREICHLEDDAYFGEIPFLLPEEERISSLIAVAPCEVFVLHRRDFLKVLSDYPELLTRMRHVAQKMLERAIIDMRDKGYDVLPPSDAIQVHENCRHMRPTYPN